MIGLVATGGLRSLGAWPLSRAEKAAPLETAAPAAPAAPAPERRPVEPTLAAILDDPAITADRASAFVSLYALWGLDARGAKLEAGKDASAERGCEIGRAAGLRCLARTGTWTVLRRLNLPAILDLTTQDGRKHHVVLASLDGERATVEIGSRRVTLPSVEVERFWDGPFVMIWRSPVTGPLPLQPGMGGRDVAWLRQRLGALDGQPLTAKPNQVYDEDLRRKVAVFQQVEALVPDGIAGEETLVRLVATAPGANGPTLNGGRP
jgi:general secretion pathway protein A